MNPLLVVLPYCQRDYKLAESLLDWSASLGRNIGHHCLLVADSSVGKSERTALAESAKKSFDGAATMIVMTRPVGFAPNFMFLDAARHVSQCYKIPWLWLEPDCVPLCPEWTRSLADGYAGCPKRYMGQFVDGNGTNGVPKLSLSGVSVYPHDAYADFEKRSALTSEIVAWDMESAEAIVPRARHTNLIHHFWGQRDLPPTFVEKRNESTSYPPGTLDITFLHRDAVLFHRCKDGSLIRCLRENRKSKQGILSKLVGTK